MKKKPYTLPDDFSASPLLSLLPNDGDYQRLLESAPSLFARLEKTKENLNDALANSEESEIANSELLMLELVASWVSSQKVNL